MDQALREEIEQVAEEYALFNAVKHDGEADVGAIMGPLMGDYPDFRQYGDQVPGLIGPVVASVNDLDPSERKQRLETLAPKRFEALTTEDEGDDFGLPELPSAESVDEVRMRCAPNPNGPWHLGNARMPAVIGTYRDHYDGWMLCRFDDTDPETKRPDMDAYDAILDAFEYLGFPPDATLKASDRVDIYYEYAEKLIGLSGAYTCSCSGDVFSAKKNAGEACPHRDKPVEIVADEFAQMCAGEYTSGEMVLRVRTDITHPNPALRDWVAFRMVDTPHPREEAAAYRCWPLLDFQSAIDDQLTEITHIIRGIDLQDSAKRQQFLYDYFDWEYPEVVHWGHVQVDAYDISMSTSTIKELVASGELDGWDDPRAPTLASLRRRGIQGEAIVNAMIELGTSTSNVDLSMQTLYAFNKELIDPNADRYFFVADGQPIHLIGDVPETAHPHRHPTDDERGTREIPVGDTVLIDPADRPAHGERVWLKGLGCVRLLRDAFEWTGADIDVVRNEDVPVIHWVPQAASVPVRMERVDDTVRGQGEPEVASVAEGSIIQFERIGFARIDQQDDETVVYFAHH